GAAAVARATMLSLCLAAFLFIAQTWLASLFVLGNTHLSSGDTAFYEIAAMVGGYWFKFLVAVPGLLFSGLAAALSGQAATARLLFGMARDGELPRPLAYVDPRRQIPSRAVFFVGAVTAVTSYLTLDHLDLLLSMISFGALLGFLL